MTKKEAIIAAALELLVEKGVHNTPMSEIAKAAGTGMGTIYNHFSCKEEIIIAKGAERIRQSGTEAYVCFIVFLINGKWLKVGLCKKKSRGKKEPYGPEFIHLSVLCSSWQPYPLKRLCRYLDPEHDQG